MPSPAATPESVGLEGEKIVQVDGLTRGTGSDGAPVAAGNGNLASDALSAALTYRAQAPIIDGLMKELGLDGSSLEGLVTPGADAPATPDAPRARKTRAVQAPPAEAAAEPSETED